MHQVIALMKKWAAAQAPTGMKWELCQLPGRTPLIFINIPPTVTPDPQQTVLLYGYLDKQPEMEGWGEGLGPWEPLLRQ